MNTIFKYELKPTDEQTIMMDYNATFLYAAEQDGKLCIWCKVNDMADKEAKTLCIYGTGHKITTSCPHLSTVLLSNGLVWHIFSPNLKPTQHD